MRLALCLLLAGCGAIESTSRVENEVESVNALSLNALSLNALSLNALSLNALSTDSLDITNTQACSTSDGRMVLKYLVGCALPWGTQLHCSGYPDVFYGNLGLAPEWSSSPLGVASQEWVSACLLSHANAFATPVQISLSGPHPALARTFEERETYAYSEATYYGNLFTTAVAVPTTDGVYPGTIGKVACQQDVASSIVNDWYLKLRICGVPDENGFTLCHFRDAGKCQPDPGQTTSACVQRDNEYDWRCAGGQIYPGWPKQIGHGGYANDHAITVYLRPSDADDIRTQACQIALQQGWVTTCLEEQEQTLPPIELPAIEHVKFE